MSDIKLSKSPVASPADPEIGKPFSVTAAVTRDPAGHISAWWTKGGAEVAGTRQDVPSPTGPVEVKLEIASFGDGDYGVYKLAAGESATGTTIDLGTEAELELKKPEPPAPAEDPGKQELRDLVWDSDFAGGTGAFLVIVLLVFGTLCAVGFGRSISSVVDGSGFTPVVVFTGLFLGIACMLVGAWLIVLEMRGRAPIDGDAPVEDQIDQKGALSDAADAATKVVSTIGKLTGPFAVLCVGGLVFAGTVWLAYATDDANRPTPPTAPTTPTTPTPGG